MLRNGDQLDIEDEIGVGGYVRSGRATAIRHGGGNYEAASTTDFHAGNAFGPAGYDAAERERNRIAKIMRALEDGAVFAERAGVVRGNRCSFGHSIASAFEKVNDL